MAQHQRTHVPKFGNWDGENVPYTTYFENARKDRGRGAKMINPNDPEENPEAFMRLKGMLKTEGTTTGQENSTHCHVPSGKSRPPVVKNHDEEQKRSNVHRLSPSISNSPCKSMNSMAASDKSSSDYSQGKHRHVKSSYKTAPIGNFSSYNHAHQRTASIPKFGAWDETDPTSGDEFTVIFSKAQEEKHKGAMHPVAPSQASNYPMIKPRQKNANSSFLSKIFCCSPSDGIK